MGLLRNQTGHVKCVIIIPRLSVYALWAIVAGGEGPSTPLPDGLAGGFTVVNELFQLLKHNEGHYNG